MKIKVKQNKVNLKFNKGWQVWIIRNEKGRVIRYYGRNFK